MERTARQGEAVDFLCYGRVGQPNVNSGYLRHLVEVVAFSVSSVGTLILNRRSNQNTIVITHNDCVMGDIYVNHGTHKQLVLPIGGPPDWRRLTQSPIHLFLLAREQLRHFCRTNSTVVNFSIENEAELKQHYGGRPGLIIIPSGVAAKQFAASQVRPELITNLKLRPDAPTAVFIGNEFDRKGLKYAIEALLLTDAPWQLIVVGGDAAKIRSASAHVKRAGLDGRVAFTGPVQNVGEYYQLARACLLLSSLEAWPLVLLEAMSCGVPAVATKVNSMSAIVTNGDNGFLVERDPADVGRALDLLATESLFTEISANAKKTVENFDWESIAQQYWDVARAKLQERRCGGAPDTATFGRTLRSRHITRASPKL